MLNPLDIYFVFCEFDEVMGPIPKFSFPEIDYDFGLQIAMKSINLFSGNESPISKSLAFLPFPAEEKKAIVRNIEWQDRKLRGGSAVSSISLIFNEADDLIFYKYVKDLEIVFDDVSKKIVQLKTLNASKEQLLEELRNIHGLFVRRLGELNKQEIYFGGEVEAFPEVASNKKVEEYLFKVIVCGDPACGKTSSILRFTQSAFRRTYIPTIGVNMTKKEVQVNNKKINLVLWDLAGHIKFQVMRRHFYEGAKGIILLFDTTRRITFESIPQWYQDIKSGIKQHDKPPAYLCGNKIDLRTERQVSNEEAKEISKKLNMEYFETSALTGENIDQMYYSLAKKIVDL
jgi:small GTP-binding protein